MTAVDASALVAALGAAGVVDVNPADVLAQVLTHSRSALVIWSVPAPASPELVASCAALWACHGDSDRVTLAQPDSAWTVDGFDTAVSSRLSVSAPEPVHLIVGSAATVSLRMFDQLLVTLESPPGPVVVHLATDGATRLPATVRSRAAVSASVTPARLSPATAAAAGVSWPLLCACAGRVDVAAALTAVDASSQWVDMWTRCPGSWDGAQAEQMVQMLMCAATGTPYSGVVAPPGPKLVGPARVKAKALVAAFADALLCAAADQVRQYPGLVDGADVSTAVSDARSLAAVNLGPDLVMHVLLAQVAGAPTCPLCAAGHSITGQLP